MLDEGEVRWYSWLESLSTVDFMWSCPPSFSLLRCCQGLKELCHEIQPN